MTKGEFVRTVRAMAEQVNKAGFPPVRAAGFVGREIDRLIDTARMEERRAAVIRSRVSRAENHRNIAGTI